MSFYNVQMNFTPDLPLVDRLRKSDSSKSRSNSTLKVRNPRNDYKRRPKNFRGWDEDTEE